MNRKILTGILASSMILGMSTVSFANSTQTQELNQAHVQTSQAMSTVLETSGICGDNATWHYDLETSVLTISGTGAMYDYDYTDNKAPWDGHKYNYDTGDKILGIVVEEGITHISAYSIWNCQYLTSLTLPSTLETLGESGLSGFRRLTTLVVPDSLTNIPKSAFSYSKLVTDFVIPPKVTSIGDNAFQDCSDLLNITIPQSVTYIGSSAFNSCDSLKQLTIPNSVTSMGNNVFFDCDKLTGVYIPASVTEIGYNLCHIIYPDSDSMYGISQKVKTTLTIYGEAGSYVETYAAENGYKFSAVTSETMPTWVDQSLLTEIPTTPEDTTTPEEPTTPESTPSDLDGYTFNTSWATSNVQFAFDNELLVDSLGKDFTVSITRAQIADLLVNMIEKASGQTLPMAEVNPFTDTSSETALKANAAGIINGKEGGLFDPDNTAKREEICIMLYRAIEKLEELTGESYIDFSLTAFDGYPDIAEISSWATYYVAIIVNNGVMSGSNGSILPKSETTIEQCLVLSNNLFKF
ncbi:MAG: leucine-rich repeat protein [Eubacteriales bacterium]